MKVVRIYFTDRGRELQKRKQNRRNRAGSTVYLNSSARVILIEQRSRADRGKISG